MSAAPNSAAIAPLQDRLALLIERQSSPRLKPSLLQVAPQLAALLTQTQHMPLGDVRRLVSRLLQEMCEVDEGGDAPVHDTRETQWHIDLIMREIEQIRHEPGPV